MESGQWLSLFIVCLLGAVSPGPSLAVVMNATMAGGRGAGVACALAHGLGVALYGALTVAGLALLITGSPTLFTGLQLLGAAYLIHLGIRALRNRPRAGDTPTPVAPARGAAASGFLVAFLNPKLAVFMLALFSQFLSPATTVAVKGIMVATVGITDASWYCLVVALVSHPALLARLRANSTAIDRVFGAILLALGCTVMLRAVLPLVA
ncbi:LysE family translocator [Parahaliea mediterranea]|uniref:LysE family translocator n=1 Tax=Parahaliea mediterranea TaxID=651086 RepID=A0A939IMY0_9GAMM|nr:LysE family translocator [Parahaliea mediterranea]MBN7798000.1 LysE family translocator [Parahaliea mediterranea]